MQATYCDAETQVYVATLLKCLHWISLHARTETACSSPASNITLPHFFCELERFLNGRSLVRSPHVKHHLFTCIGPLTVLIGAAIINDTAYILMVLLQYVPFLETAYTTFWTGKSMWHISRAAGIMQVLCSFVMLTLRIKTERAQN